MNDIPTPITDAMELYDNMCEPSRVVDSSICRALERQLAALTSRIREWQSISASEIRLRCGELSAQDIRNIKAVLESILPTNNETK